MQYNVRLALLHVKKLVLVADICYKTVPAVTALAPNFNAFCKGNVGIQNALLNLKLKKGHITIH